MSLLKSGFIVAFFTFLSRILGLVRELFIASLFGTSYIADSVNVAFKLPNLFRRIFAEGAMQVVFIPIFNEKLEHSKKMAKDFAGNILSILILSLIALTIIIQLFMPNLMLVIAPGFNSDPKKYALTVLLCRITMPYIIFISLVAFFGGMLNSIGKYIVFAASPVVMNIVLIAATILMQNKMDTEYAICWAIVISGIVQVVIVIYYVYKNSLWCSLGKLKYDQNIKKFLSKMVPAVMSSGAIQLNLFISQSIASFIPGAVSILSYAERLYQFPLSIIGITFSTILLPNLSKLYKTNQLAKANKMQQDAIKIAIILSMPGMVGIITLSYPIMHVIYERGAFTSIDTYNTATALSAFALGLPAFILSKILTPAFYANQDTTTPFKITLYSLGVNTLLNIILMNFIGHIGIALGSSIAAWFNIWLLIKFAKRYDFYKKIEHKRFSIKILLCTICMSLFIILVMYKIGDMLYTTNIIIKTTLLSLIICSAILIYFILILLTKVITLEQISKIFIKK